MPVDQQEDLPSPESDAYLKEPPWPSLPPLDPNVYTQDGSWPNMQETLPLDPEIYSGEVSGRDMQDSAHIRNMRMEHYNSVLSIPYASTDAEELPSETKGEEVPTSLPEGLRSPEQRAPRSRRKYPRNKKRLRVPPQHDEKEEFDLQAGVDLGLEFDSVSALEPRHSVRCLYPCCNKNTVGLRRNALGNMHRHQRNAHPEWLKSRTLEERAHVTELGTSELFHNTPQTALPTQGAIRLYANGSSSLSSSSSTSYAGASDSEVTEFGYAGLGELNYTSLAARGNMLNSDGGADTQPPTMSLRDSNAADFEDTKTIYLDSSSEPGTKERYISELADNLFDEIYAEQFGIEMLNKISESLPELLKAFALRIGYKAQSQMHRDIMFSIHKNRGDIANSFKQSHALKNTDPFFSAGFTIHDSMPLQERVNLWLASTEFPPVPEQSSCGDENEIYAPEAEYEDKDSKIGETSSACRNLTSKGPAYVWLAENLQRQVNTIPEHHNYMDDIRTKIIAFLPSSRIITRTESSEAFYVIFMTGFKPFDFIKEQEYPSGLEPGDAIMKSITLTGSLNDAQALPCAQYLIQTWPSTGEDVVELIKKVLRGPASTYHKCTLWDKTELSISIQGSELIAEALGPSPSVAEVGEQMAWLSAAFQASPHEARVSICVPSIQDIRIINGPELDPQILRPPIIQCKLGFRTQEHDEVTALSRGQCWHKLFKNPVVVIGYPIPRRPSAGTERGLEIPLNMMAALAGTNHIQLFNKKLYIKRFSTMLVPTKREGDILVWHLLYRPDGEHISYLDSADAGHIDGLDISETETPRHILGWCLDARYYAGAPDANYEGIRESGLPIPDEGNSALGGVHIQGRRIIKGGFPVILGKRDIPPHIPRDDFGRRLQWIDEKPFVLWDEEDKRGWLVNGSSALLHLLRKSLDSSGAPTNKFNFKFCFKKESMQEAPVTHTPASAVRVLWNETNLKLKLYPKTEGHFCVQDRVDELLNILEQITDHQINVGRREFENESSGEFLEGWDFNDLATSEDSYHPRCATFARPSGGWIKYSRVINAAILFGRRFGEIIRAENIACSRWATVPTGKYYLAAAMDDLKEIMKKNGSLYSSPMRLANDINWHTPNAIFEKCKCEQGEKHNGKHSNFVQVLLPTRLFTQLPVNFQKAYKFTDVASPKHAPSTYSGLSSERKAGNGGAVIFGQNRKLQRLVDSIQQGNPGSCGTSSGRAEHDSGSHMHDSGVGQSLSPSLILDQKCSDYRVGIVCALPKEFWAVRALFDVEHGVECLRSLCGAGDKYVNNYALGCIHRHNVVAVCLSSGGCGLSPAAAVYAHLTRSFRELKLCLLVGIGGGVPSKNTRLGDVVVSHPDGTYPGVVQYDFGKELDKKFEIKGCLHRPPQFILGAISNIIGNPNIARQPLQQYLDVIERKDPKYGHPGREKDPLFKATDRMHGQNSDTSANINPTTTQSSLRIKDHPEIHYGLIGSANRVMKNAKKRDSLSKKYNLLCFEMEAAAIMDAGDCLGLVIRGISDYSDSQKDDDWQNYAAATAAAYAKLLLCHTMIPGDVESLPMVSAETRSKKRLLSPEQSQAGPLKKPKLKKAFDS